MEQQNQIQIKFDDKDLKPVYSNMVEIRNTKEEILLTFFGVFPPVGNLLARIAMSPAHAKRLMQVLQKNIEIYEKQFNNIEPAQEKKIPELNSS